MIRIVRHRRRASRHGIATVSASVALAAVAVAAVAIVGLAGGAAARIVVPTEDAVPVLTSLEDAFRAGDHEALTALLSAQGVRVSLGPVADRTSEMTPNQAYYYFKSLFQDRQTVAFAFEKHQEVDGGRLQAVALWRYGSPAATQTRQRLLFALVHESDGWRVTEITAWR